MSILHGAQLAFVVAALLASGCNKRERAAPAASTAATSPDRPASKAASTSRSAGKPPQDLAQATPQQPLRPEPPSGPTVRNAPKPPSDAPPKLDGLKLPAGFAIELYTDEVPHARSLARGKKGTLFVSTRRDNRVYAVVDGDGDHRVDQVHTIVEGLDTPNGIAYKDGSLYVAQIGRIVRLDGIDERLKNPPKPVLVTDKLPEHPHHGWRYIRFGPDGLLYVPIGAPCNNCLRKEPVFASVSRMKPDGSRFEVFASGVRNSVGFDWHPETKELWFTENGRDELGNDLPPDELNRAPKPGLHFGYPHCHGGVIQDPEFGEGHPCTKFEPPVRNLGPHVAALGMRFYTGKMFPTRYRGAVLIAEHGSWNREKKLGYRVTLVRLNGNKALSYEPFISGFLDESKDEVWGRPVDLEILDDGSLLISDDWKGAIYRVSHSSG